MEAAAIRELKEEGGIELTGPAEFFAIYLQAAVSRRDHVALYVCRDWIQQAPPKVPNIEIVAIGFFPVDALPEGTTPATRRRLAEIAGTEIRSPEW